MAILDLRIDIEQRKPVNAAAMERQADAAIEAGLTEMGEILVSAVKEETPLGATKILRGSIYSELRGTPVRELLVSTPHAYGAIVERGRQPGKFPKQGPILLWVKRKLGIADEKEAHSVAFLVARKIARKGTSGAAQFFKGFTRARPPLERVAQKIGGTIVAEWEK